MLVNSLKELPLFMIRSMIDSLSAEKELFSFCCWSRWCLLDACGRVIGGVVSLDFPIGGIGFLGATDLTHCLVRVSTTCVHLGLVFSAGFSP